MNKYFAIAGLVLFILWSGFMYYQGYGKASVVCASADAKHDLAQQSVVVAAQNNVIATVSKQQSVTQGVDYVYQIKKNDIANQYVAGLLSLQHTSDTASNSGHTISGAACQPHAPTARPFITRVFRLNRQECDENTEQLYSLQSWVKGQQAIKRVK